MPHNLWGYTHLKTDWPISEKNEERVLTRGTSCWGSLGGVEATRPAGSPFPGLSGMASVANPDAPMDDTRLGGSVEAGSRFIEQGSGLYGVREGK